MVELVGFWVNSRDTTDQAWLNCTYMIQNVNNGDIDASSSDNVGGMIGMVDNDSNCMAFVEGTVTSDITAQNDTGGVIGLSNGTNGWGDEGGIEVDDVTSSGEIDSNGSDVGGLVGNLRQYGDSVMVVYGSSSSMDINDTGANDIGGLIGVASSPSEELVV